MDELAVLLEMLEAEENCIGCKLGMFHLPVYGEHKFDHAVRAAALRKAIDHLRNTGV